MGIAAEIPAACPPPVSGRPDEEVVLAQLHVPAAVIASLADWPGAAAWLAALVVAAHLAFVAFAAGGSLLALRWPGVAWVQIPAASWAAYVEISGGVCPLTPLENALRRQAGLDAYSGDFVSRYVFPVLYPEGLTREAQTAIGLFVLGVNVGVYGWLVYRRVLGGGVRARVKQ
jgi:hypothetical protein